MLFVLLNDSLMMPKLPNVHVVGMNVLYSNSLSIGFWLELVYIVQTCLPINESIHYVALSIIRTAPIYMLFRKI